MADILSTRNGARRAVVAGGGIGGMAAALALARGGWSVTVCERADEISEVGAGLQLSPNATRALASLGVLEAVSGAAFRPQAATMRDGRTGAEIFRLALAGAAERRWGSSYLHIHRADLLSALTGAAREAGAELMTGAAATGWEERGEAVSISLESGQSLPADLLVAADGVRSNLRERMHGPTPVRFTGQIAWRATIPSVELPEGLVAPEATVWVGPGRHLVTYYLRRGAQVNIVAVEERDRWTEESWSLAGEPDHLRVLFDGWHDRVTGLLARIEAPLKWGLFDRPDPPSWVSGRVVLLGDACHPMLPFMAQGAAMAIEDAVVLAGALSRMDVKPALERYERLRRPRTARAQAVSRANGRLFHRAPGLLRELERAPLGLAARFAPGLAASRLDWLYGDDAGAVARGDA